MSIYPSINILCRLLNSYILYHWTSHTIVWSNIINKRQACNSFHNNCSLSWFSSYLAFPSSWAFFSNNVCTINWLITPVILCCSMWIFQIQSHLVCSSDAGIFYSDLDVCYKPGIFLRQFSEHLLLCQHKEYKAVKRCEMFYYLRVLTDKLVKPMLDLHTYKLDWTCQHKE